MEMINLELKSCKKVITLRVVFPFSEKGFMRIIGDGNAFAEKKSSKKSRNCTKRRLNLTNENN